jgi:hypothetical protein
MRGSWTAKIREWRGRDVLTVVCTRAAEMAVDEFLLQVLGDKKRHWGDRHGALQHHGVAWRRHNIEGA